MTILNILVNFESIINRYSYKSTRDFESCYIISKLGYFYK